MPARFLASSGLLALSVAALCASVSGALGQQSLDVRSDAPPPDVQRRATDAIPLSADLIRELARRYGETERAREEGGTQIATPVSRGVNVSFSPGAATSIVETVKGYPTALSFFDATGQPWPIAWNANSNAANVSAGSNCSTSGAGGGGAPAVEATGFYSCVPVKGGNVLQITPMSLTPRGGLLVNLEGAPKPLTFLLMAGGSRYDADLSFRVGERGPKAKLQIDTRPGAPVTGAPFMNAMLSGIAPADARPLSVEGVSPDDIRAWRLGSDVFIRTRHTLLSPPWSASENGEGNVTVYALPATPVVLLAINGRTTSAVLKDQ